MYTYNVSAKTGDQVNAMFYRIAADLAGVVLSRPEVEVATVGKRRTTLMRFQKIVKAEIVNHANVEGVAPPKPDGAEKKKACVVQ
jgi:hypothetical protein